ncbi:hypothetical protein JTE90_009702 [Oedothorax gibbosus]|uniref:Uncharacterized protein n=1 Tax=Oedothorax gibbosus TaxID=931172 RepID=A0AAV6V7K6_9ARAC|nr:hypothetical protein JTE90_009702 [Oedothorax gibbosus]
MAANVQSLIQYWKNFDLPQLQVSHCLPFTNVRSVREYQLMAPEKSSFPQEQYSHRKNGITGDQVLASLNPFFFFFLRSTEIK